MKRINAVATGENLKQLIKSKHLSIKIVAQELHVSEKTIRRWMHGSCPPHVENLYNLAKMLDVRIEDILVMEDENDKKIHSESESDSDVDGREATETKPPEHNIEQGESDTGYSGLLPAT